ncbi:uncharacterized protein DEA37_0007949, partial [Paragonimus westermani]
VSEGMIYLEQNHFLHRDLRSSNVLVDSQNQLKVADFGLSHMLGDSEEYLGTSRFTSKEVKERVCSGYRLPRPLMKISAAPFLPTQEEYEVSRIDNYLCPTELYNKMLECWRVEPDFRPSFVELNTFLEAFRKTVKNLSVA